MAESRLKEGASQAEEKKAMQDEGRDILEKLKGHDGVVVALDRKGRSLESLQMAVGWRVWFWRGRRRWHLSSAGRWGWLRRY